VAGGVADRCEVDGLARQAVTCEWGARGTVFDEGVDFSFVGICDRSAGMSALCWLVPCSR